MNMQSELQQLGQVPFPAFTGERVYMREFTRKSGLPADLRRWQDTVDAMLDGVESERAIYIMVDQAPVEAGRPHRRPGVHVDGWWDARRVVHQMPPHRFAGRHGWRMGAWDTKPTWGYDPVDERIILASDVFGCVGYAGEYEFAPGKGGDFSHADLSSFERVEFEPGLAYLGRSVAMLHESVPVRRDARRTVVRLNVQ